MSEEGFVRFAATTYALDEAFDDLQKEREEEEEEERAKQLAEEAEEHAQWEETVSRKQKRSIRPLNKPKTNLAIDPWLHTLLTTPR